MNLVRQTALWNNDGNADKVYEVDLLETAPGKYVVNFRYGRRGATLKDGTKTALPVALPQAEIIFNKLVEEKRKGGYKDTDNYVAPTEATPESGPAIPIVTSNKPGYVLQCLREATQPVPGKIIEKWPLGRIIWRAGELGIAAVAPLIIPQLTKGDALHQYTACWSLGRCGNVIAIAPLQQVYASKATASYVKRIAIAALLQLTKANGVDEPILQTLLQSLPTDLQASLQQGDASNITEQLTALAQNPATLETITTVYLLAEKYETAATAIYEWLTVVPIVPNNFKVVRHIFKLAEFKEDARTFCLLAHKFEKIKGLYAANRYNRNSYVLYNGKYYNYAVEELKKATSTLAYSDRTHHYLNRRVWRTMRTLGKDGSETYVRYAFGVLLHYNNGLSGQASPQEQTNSFYRYDQNTRRYETHTVSKLFSAYPTSGLLNHILYANSSRYFLKRNNHAWQLQPGSPTTEAVKREEAFPELWDKYPQALAQLLLDSEVEPVHVFAAKALSGRGDIARFFDIAALRQLLQKPFAVTARLALQLAENKYNAAEPDEELLIALLLHPVPEARALALKWVTAQVAYFLKKTTLIAYAIVNPYEDVFEAAGKWLTEQNLTEADAERLCTNVMEQLLAMPKEMPLASEAATHAAQLLSSYFLPVLSQLSLEAPTALLQHPLAPIQLLGSIILLNHHLQPQHFNDGLLSSMIQADNPQVRQVGITLFGRLPQEELFNNTELIAAFCVSPYGEIRTTIQPIVQTLNEKNKAFGQALMQNLLPYLQRKETAEGLHQNLFQLFTTVLAEHLVTVDEPTALAFVHSRFPVPQLLGLFILRIFGKATGFSMRQWIRMANHEVLDIRQFAWDLYRQHVARVQAEAAESLRILDSSWADSRAFAFEFFRKHFIEETWTPELLVSVCDSTRPDVQAFGREMITKYFKEENGELYLMQLSQHPAQQVQHFTTHYLEQFAADKPMNIEKLEAYFVTVLSSVNKAGIAKKRIFRFLQEEALKNEAVAELAAKIMVRQSATMAVADKAACIAIMYQLQKKYPAMQMPLTIVPVAGYATNV
jgi:predicted DNA-binding WGR domain protein